MRRLIVRGTAAIVLLFVIGLFAGYVYLRRSLPAFDGTLTVCVFAWEERARESSEFNLAEVRRRVAKW